MVAEEVASHCLSKLFLQQLLCPASKMVSSTTNQLLAVVLVTFCFSVISGQQQSTVAEMCAKARGGLVPHEKYCDAYYRCDKSTGQPVMVNCPNGLAFAGYKRGLVGNCDYPFRVGCPEAGGEKVMGQPPLNSGNCDWAYGIFAHESSCTRYWQCWNGTAALQRCPFSLLYNDQLHACDWPDNVPDCQKHPLCKEANSRVPIENSCTRYYQCIHGYPRLLRCPGGTAFSREENNCTWDYMVKGCEPPPPPSNDVDGGSTGNNGSSQANSRDSVLASA
ncbi:Chitin-binding domain type 2 [Tyrophagus putrescentiae]|nr:Chitin-binding domain type 2 [Tyrophagus putrescentiae]